MERKGLDRGSQMTLIFLFSWFKELFDKSRRVTDRKQRLEFQFNCVMRRLIEVNAIFCGQTDLWSYGKGKKPLCFHAC